MGAVGSGARLAWAWSAIAVFSNVKCLRSIRMSGSVAPVAVGSGSGAVGSGVVGVGTIGSGATCESPSVGPWLALPSRVTRRSPRGPNRRVAIGSGAVGSDAYLRTSEPEAIERPIAHAKQTRRSAGDTSGLRVAAAMAEEQGRQCGRAGRGAAEDPHRVAPAVRVRIGSRSERPHRRQQARARAGRARTFTRFASAAH